MTESIKVWAARLADASVRAGEAEYDLAALSEEYLRQHPNIRESLRITQQAAEAIRYYNEAARALQPQPIIVTTGGTGTP